MGRRKIEIKAIKDDRNRSVTFLKRKGGLFKKAHELSVLCSVDVAVFIFGSNKKLYEYSSCDMRDMITRYTFHGGPNEHKGPVDFNGGTQDDDDDDDENGTPPRAEGMDTHLGLPPQFAGQPGFPHMRHHTPSASPPIPNGMQFPPHPGHPGQRGHTPQPQMGSRPTSRNDMSRMAPGMGQVPVSQPTPPVNGFAFMPQPAIYNPQNQPNMAPNMPPHGLPPQGPKYPYPPPPPPPPAHAHQMQPYMDDQRRSSLPPSFPPQGPHPQQVPQPVPQQVQHHTPSPPQPHPQQLPPQPIPHISPPPPQPQQLEPPQTLQEPPPPAPMETKPEPTQDRQPSLLDTAIKKLPQRKQHSIFTPIDENRSILSQHLASFAEPKPVAEPPPPPPAVGTASRSQSVDVGSVSRSNANTSSPPLPQRSNTGATIKSRNVSTSAVPETTFTPPSRSNSLRVGGAARPRLKVQIPDEQSDNGSATAESAGSPRNSTEATSTSTRRNGTDSHSSGVVLPPPSPSATSLLSAGATGPPNPFARPPPSHSQSNSMNIDTPVSALPSRFLNEYLPSPSSFYPEWNFGSRDSNTLPSPLNFATPVVGTGPSFLRDDNSVTSASGGNANNNNNTNKRKSPEASAGPLGSDGPEMSSEAKRIKVDS